MPRAEPSRRASLARVATVYLIAVFAAVLTGLALDRPHPLFVTAAADLVATLVVFAASVRYRNSSLYDPYWSVAPICIAAYWLYLGSGGELHIPALAALALVVGWGGRLTWNWAERWRGLGDEDWRYVDFQKRTGRWYWLVCFAGIHLFPTVIVFAGCLPLYPVLTGGGQDLGPIDGAALLITASAVWLEASADAELRRHRAGATRNTATLTTGVWAWSRHPNYLGEMGFWWGLYLFGLAADPSWWWTIAAPVAMTLLFLLYSIPAMEKRLSRRDGWAEYARRTPRLVGGRPDA